MKYVYLRVKLIKGYLFLDTINFRRSHCRTSVRAIKFKCKSWTSSETDETNTFAKYVCPGGAHSAHTDNLVEKEGYFRSELALSYYHQ